MPCDLFCAISPQQFPTSYCDHALPVQSNKRAGEERHSWESEAHARTRCKIMTTDGLNKMENLDPIGLLVYELRRGSPESSNPVIVGRWIFLPSCITRWNRVCVVLSVPCMHGRGYHLLASFFRLCLLSKKSSYSMLFLFAFYIRFASYDFPDYRFSFSTHPPQDLPAASQFHGLCSSYQSPAFIPTRCPNDLIWYCSIFQTKLV